MISGSGVNSSDAMTGSMATTSITNREGWWGALDVKWDRSRVQNQ